MVCTKYIKYRGQGPAFRDLHQVLISKFCFSTSKPQGSLRMRGGRGRGGELKTETICSKCHLVAPLKQFWNSWEGLGKKQDASRLGEGVVNPGLISLSLQVESC